MNTLAEALETILRVPEEARKPLGVILAGHNGSGKSTMWRQSLAARLQIPLINADRMMLSILPEAGADGLLVPWAVRLRDTNEGWMRVAHRGVQAFVGHAMAARVPFAMETVFSYWEPGPDGKVASKIDLIIDLQAAGYFDPEFHEGFYHRIPAACRKSAPIPLMYDRKPWMPIFIDMTGRLRRPRHRMKPS